MVVTDGADRLREGATVQVVVPNAGTKGGADGSGGARRRQDGASSVTGTAPTAIASGARPAAAPGQASAPAAAAPTTTPPATTPVAAAPASEDPPWMSRLPPEVADRIRAMSPEERAAWIQKRREERAKNTGAN
jgi:multidrug efflux system membrane fusion protein